MVVREPRLFSPIEHSPGTAASAKSRIQVVDQIVHKLLINVVVHGGLTQDRDEVAEVRSLVLGAVGTAVALELPIQEECPASILGAS